VPYVSRALGVNGRPCPSWSCQPPKPVLGSGTEFRLLSSEEQGGAKRRAEGMGVTGHDGKLTQPVCGVVNANWFAVCAASVMSVPP
jgi:hypothetical protein